MTQAAAALKLGMSTVRLNELVRGKRGVTADTALRLAQFFKTTPQFWMHMQANFDLKAAMARRRAMKLGAGGRALFRRLEQQFRQDLAEGRGRCAAKAGCGSNLVGAPALGPGGLTVALYLFCI